MVDRVVRWEPLIVGVCAPLIVALLIAVASLLWQNTTNVVVNTKKISSIAAVQPGMTEKLRHITALLGGVQTKADSYRQHERLRTDIQTNDKRITVLENQVDRLDGTR